MSNEDGDGADGKRIESSQLARLGWVLHQRPEQPSAKAKAAH